MTELVDLIENPKEKLSTLYQKYVNDLEKSFEKEEKQLDSVFIRYRTNIAVAHEKLLDSYKHLYEDMLCRLDEEQDPVIVLMFQELLRSERREKDTLCSIFEKLLPALQNMRKNGGTVDFDVKANSDPNASIHRSGMMGYWDDGKYFNFTDSFFDDECEKDWKYSIEKRRKTWEEKKKEAEAKRFTVFSSNSTRDLVKETVDELGPET